MLHHHRLLSAAVPAGPAEPVAVLRVAEEEVVVAERRTLR